MAPGDNGFNHPRKGRMGRKRVPPQLLKYAGKPRAIAARVPEGLRVKELGLLRAGEKTA